ncbi:MAG: NifU family protein [Candidatus Poseidoniaceae archaeon]|nr:NifU family protein [Candidatus Poseidoniaceae archaeon]
MEDDILEQYRLEAAAAMEVEANKRIAESSDVEMDEALRNSSLYDLEDIVPALLSRLGPVRAALDGHGGGISLTSKNVQNDGLHLVLDLTGACLSCGAAPGTLQGVKTDLEADEEIAKVSFCSSLLDTFDDLGREFILAHGKVDFV